MLPIILFLPVIQLLILANAATFEIKLVNFHLINFDNSTKSRELVEKFTSTNYFIQTGSSYSVKSALEEIYNRKARMIMVIPQNFEKDIITGKAPKIQIILNAEDGAAAAIINSYVANILMSYNRSIILNSSLNGINLKLVDIDVQVQHWYNREMDYKQYMVPGILVILVTIIGMFLSAMNIVKEKEIGTIEQLNVTPIRKIEFIAGKLIPFWIIAIIELAYGLVIAKIFFTIPILGSLLLIFGLAALFLLVVQSFGLFISTITETQQQALFVAWFFAVVFILLSGLFTPIDSMPKWTQAITEINPIAHFIEIMRRVMLKGAGFFEIQKQFFILVIYSVIMIALSIWRYRKVAG